MNKTISILKNIFIKHKLEDVFTPATVAKLTYIVRPSIESEFKKYLTIPGMQIVIYGNSGNGKTTLVNNILKKNKINQIRTSCTELTTFDQILLDAFDRLGKFYISERVQKKGTSVNTEFSIKYNEIAAGRKTSESNENSEKKVRIVPLQLTPQRLAEFLGESNCVWIVEDFHKVQPEEKKKLAQVLKVFMDCSNDFPVVRIICIGAVESARELLQYDKDLANRVAELYVPPMSKEELAQIVRIGFSLMNVDVENKDVGNKITIYSNSLASVCHQLCYNMCYGSHIIRNSIFTKVLNDLDFTNSVKAYLGTVSDTFTRNFERACSIPKCKMLLQEVIDREEEYFDPKTDASGKDINEVKAMEKEKILFQLTSTEYGEVFRKNPDSKLYSFTNPFFMTFLKMKLTLVKTEKEAKQTGTRFQINELFQNESKFLDYLNIMNSTLKITYEEESKINNSIVIEPLIVRSTNKKQELKRENIENKSRQHNYYKKR
jgi:hypothetical protein